MVDRKKITDDINELRGVEEHISILLQAIEEGAVAEAEETADRRLTSLLSFLSDGEKANPTSQFDALFEALEELEGAKDMARSLEIAMQKREAIRSRILGK